MKTFASSDHLPPTSRTRTTSLALAPSPTSSGCYSVMVCCTSSGLAIARTTEASLSRFLRKTDKGRRSAHGGVTASSAYQEKPTKSSHLAPQVHQRNPWILQNFSLRIDREQHVPDSSNHSLYLTKLFSFSYPGDNGGGNQP